MAIKYDLTAIEMLRLLGYTEPVGKMRLEEFEKENNVKLPSLLLEFLSLAWDNSLFSTADIWTTESPFLFFFYEEIEEEIEERKEEWEENPEDCAEDEYFQLFQMPKEQWISHVSNYLEIGSDYAAGVVNFGIRTEDLTQENPPVYMLHEEADSLTDWKILDNSLLDYFMRVLCDVLVCVEYDTAKRVLQKAGWSFYEYDNLEETQQQLSQRRIDLSAMKKYSSLYDVDEFYRCCYDEEEKILFVIGNDMSLTMLKVNG